MTILKRSNILKHILFSFLQRPILYHNKILSQIVDIRNSVKVQSDTTPGKPTFLLRVDDFPRWDKTSDQFLSFHEILFKNEIPYLLGVTPFPSRNPFSTATQDDHAIESRDLDILKQITKCGAEIAMHGYSHQTINLHRKTEIVGLPAEQLESKILKGLEKLRLEGLPTDFFIPCFNSFDALSLRILRKYFKVICGGPESVLHIGLKFSPSYIDNTLYIPSYYPAYGKAKELLLFIENVKKIKENIIIPLTLHWAWEIENDFIDVHKLCNTIKGQTLSWQLYFLQSLEIKSQLRFDNLSNSK